VICSISDLSSKVRVMEGSIRKTEKKAEGNLPGVVLLTF